MSDWINLVQDRLHQEFGDRGRICILATADAVGRPTARAMTLRHVDNEGTLVFVSDRRTRKDSHIRSRPEVEVVFWLAKLNCQIRLRGHAAVIGAEMDDYMRSTWWANLDAKTAKAISGADNSGDHPLPSTFELISIQPQEVEIDEYRRDGKHSTVWKLGDREWTPVAIA
jgi:general stress protein 26